MGKVALRVGRKKKTLILIHADMQWCDALNIVQWRDALFPTNGNYVPDKWQLEQRVQNGVRALIFDLISPDLIRYDIWCGVRTFDFGKGARHRPRSQTLSLERRHVVRHHRPSPF